MQHNGIGFVSLCLFPYSLAQLSFRFVSLNQQAGKVKTKKEMPHTRVDKIGHYSSNINSINCLELPLSIFITVLNLRTVTVIMVQRYQLFK